MKMIVQRRHSVYAGWRFCLILLLILASPLVAAERNILEEEVKNDEALLSEIKRINKRDRLSNADEATGHWQTEILLLKERNSTLKGRASSRDFTIYAESQPVANAYLKQAETVLNLYEKLFPRSSFLPASPAQILIYRNQDDYSKYEHVPLPAISHALSTRAKKISIVKRGNMYTIEPISSSNLKEHRLATFRQDVPYVFAHEVSHILTYELANPGRLSNSNVKISMFLNEGLAEYFSFCLYPETLAKRLGELKAVYGLVSDAKLEGVDLTHLRKNSGDLENFPLQDFLSMKEYPPAPRMTQFYGEATLFVNWLMRLPDGPNLVGGLLTISNPDQMEALMKQYQRDHRLPVVGWEQYKRYRKEILEGGAAPRG